MEQKFNKHYCKRDPGTLAVLVENGKEIKDDEGNITKIIGGDPVLGEIAKSDIPLTQRHADILNASWKETGIYYAKLEESEIIEKELRKELFDKAKELFENDLIDKMPQKNISTEKLKELIGE